MDTRLWKYLRPVDYCSLKLSNRMFNALLEEYKVEYYLIWMHKLDYSFLSEDLIAMFRMMPRMICIQMWRKMSTFAKIGLLLRLGDLKLISMRGALKRHELFFNTVRYNRRFILPM